MFFFNYFFYMTTICRTYVQTGNRFVCKLCINLIYEHSEVKSYTSNIRLALTIHSVKHFLILLYRLSFSISTPMHVYEAFPEIT